MAGNRKRRYTCEEALSFLLGDTETLENTNSNVPCIKEQFDEIAFQNVPTIPEIPTLEERDADVESIAEQFDEDDNELHTAIPDIPTLEEINADIQNIKE